MPIRRNVAALRLCNLHKVATHACEADCLGRSRPFVRRRHLLQVIMINAEEDRGGHQNSDKSAHLRIVALPGSSRKRRAWPGALGNNGVSFSLRSSTRLLNFTLPRIPLPGV